MKKIKQYFLSILLFFILFLITLYFIFSQYSITDFIKTLSNCNPIYILLAFICIIIYLLLGSFVIKRLFSNFNVKTNLFQNFCYTCIEKYFSAVTPFSTGGQPVEMYYMAKDRIPYRKSTIVILINTMLYKLAIVLLGIVGMICFPNLIFQNGFLFLLLMLIGLIINIIVVIFFGLLVFSPKLPQKIINGSINFLSYIHLIKPELKKSKQQEAEKALKEYRECANFAKKNPSLLTSSFLLILLQRITLFGISYLIYRSFGLNEYSFFAILFLQISITQATDSVPFPGGVMAGESLTYQISSFIYGSELAFSSMLLQRGMIFYIPVLISSIFFIFYHFLKRKKYVKNN